jgi:small subunit ribosomal protein S9
MEVLNTIGRRKTSVARVYVSKGAGKVTVNNRDYTDYFKTLQLQNKIKQPFAISKTTGKFDVQVNVSGGGITGQAEAVRLAISRALCKHDLELRPALKAEGMLTRDPRMVERKKFGQKKARKRFQFSKR